MSDLRNDPDELRRLYVEQRKSTREIAALLGLSQPWARKILLDCGIPMRSHAENKMPVAKGSKLRPEHARAISDSLRGKKRPGRHHNWQRIPLPCEICGAIVEVRRCYRKRHPHVFCGSDCATAWRKSRCGKDHPNFKGGPIEVACLQCGRKILRKRAEYLVCERFFCSCLCKGAWFSANVNGAQIYNWKGGYEPYYGERWKPARAKARVRDNHTCQRCGKSKADIGKNLDVHHIRPFRQFGAERHVEANALNNLITYCPSCHKLVEEEMDRKNRRKTK
jgi:5-methylcytosine-specific restriction endonuclease McrA